MIMEGIIMMMLRWNWFKHYELSAMTKCWSWSWIIYIHDYDIGHRLFYFHFFFHFSIIWFFCFHFHFSIIWFFCFHFSIIWFSLFPQILCGTEPLPEKYRAKRCFSYINVYFAYLELLVISFESHHFSFKCVSILLFFSYH